MFNSRFSMLKFVDTKNDNDDGIRPMIIIVWVNMTDGFIQFYSF